MSQPTPYNRVFSFTNDQTANPSTKTPGNQLDSEYNAILTSISQILANLVLIQRDDGQLANQTVGAAQLKPELTGGVQPSTVWATATSYGVNATVFNGLKLYRCLVAHISGTFATDLGAGDWTLLADFSTGIAAVSGVSSIAGQSGTMTIPGGAIGSTILPLARYDVAQSLTSAQTLQMRRNQGVGTTSALSAAVDFNTITAPGVYHTVDTSSVNAPTTLENWYLAVVEDGANPGTNVLQVATRKDGASATTGCFLRTLVTGSWTNWQQVLTDQNGVRYDVAQSLTAAQKSQARSNIYAAPFDALAYSGMQVNGSIDVSQELGATGATLASAAAARYIADCFSAQYTGAVGVLTSAQIASSAPSATAVVGLPNAINLKATTKMAAQASQSDGDFACITHPIEGYRVARLGLGSASANSFSIGVWWYATNPGTTFFRVSNVASGAGRYYYQEVTLAAGWNYVTATIPGDITGTWQQTTSLGLVIKFYGAGKNTTPVATTSGVAAWSATEKVATTNSTSLLSTTNNDLIAITGLIVVPGGELPSSTRAPFIMRPYDQELLLCARQHWIPVSGAASAPLASGFCYTATTALFSLQLPVEMRAAPSLAISAASDFSVFLANGTDVNCTALTVNAVSTRRMVRLDATVASGLVAGNGTVLHAANVSSLLRLDARL